MKTIRANISKRKCTPAILYNVTNMEYLQETKLNAKFNFNVSFPMQSPSKLLKLPNVGCEARCQTTMSHNTTFCAILVIIQNFSEKGYLLKLIIRVLLS